MDDNKSKKSFNILVDVNQLLNGKPASLYQGKTQAWRRYFKAWARRTLEQDYLLTLVNHRLSITAHSILKENPMNVHEKKDIDIFLKGVAYGIEMIYGDIKTAGTKEQINKEEDK